MPSAPYFDRCRAAKPAPTGDKTPPTSECASWHKGRARKVARNPLRVMKFGGTSVGDAFCIARVVEIVRAASGEGDLLVVVSAMSGVTNKLIEAAKRSEMGDREGVEAILKGLRNQHEAVVSALICSVTERLRIARRLHELFRECERLCRATTLRRNLTPQMNDAVSSFGERLAALLLATALAERGVRSNAVDATEVVVTDAWHGAAEPFMESTQKRSHARLHPLLRQGVVPVVTGFIGATPEGVLTTLGRGGSDYSATILGAALEADEVTIWTDVDGLLTADPDMVPCARTIPEISYREAAELSSFGAKVLHPKTLRAVMHFGIPLWIRNTFAPERRGTMITPAGLPDRVGVKALTAISDVALITVASRSPGEIPDVWDRAAATAAAHRVDVVQVSRSSSPKEICLAVSSSFAKRTVDALRSNFAPDLPDVEVEEVTLERKLAMVTVVGQGMRARSGVVKRFTGALGRENVNIIAITRCPSGTNVSVVVAESDMQRAVVTGHMEFELGGADLGDTSRPTSMAQACDAI